MTVYYYYYKSCGKESWEGRPKEEGLKTSFENRHTVFDYDVMRLA